jgi:hypothetical protein
VLKRIATPFERSCQLLPLLPLLLLLLLLLLPLHEQMIPQKDTSSFAEGRLKLRKLPK